MTDGPKRAPRVRRGFLYALVAVALAAGGVVGVIQLVGFDIGGPCRDSYDCKGFLIGGAECLQEDDGEAYCTVYCDRDAQCPSQWRCVDANPTVMTVETTALDGVCQRP